MHVVRRGNGGRGGELETNKHRGIYLDPMVGKAGVRMGPSNNISGLQADPSTIGVCCDRIYRLRNIVTCHTGNNQGLVFAETQALPLFPLPRLVVLLILGSQIHSSCEPRTRRLSVDLAWCSLDGNRGCDAFLSFPVRMMSRGGQPANGSRRRTYYSHPLSEDK